MQDSLSGAVLGTNGFSKTLIGFLAASAGPSSPWISRLRVFLPYFCLPSGMAFWLVF